MAAIRARSAWRNHIEKPLGEWPLSTIGSWDIESWATHLDGGPHAKASAVRLLKQLLHEATRHKLLRVDPSESIEVPSVPKHIDRIMSVDEADRLVEAITRPGARKDVPRDEPYPREPTRSISSSCS